MPCRTSLPGFARVLALSSAACVGHVSEIRAPAPAPAVVVDKPSAPPADPQEPFPGDLRVPTPSRHWPLT